MAFLYFLCALLGLWLLFMSLFTRDPKTFISGLVLTVFSIKFLAKGASHKRKKHLPGFLEEKPRVAAILDSKPAMSTALPALMATYEIWNKGSGVTLRHGRCDVIDLIGPAATVRIFAKEGIAVGYEMTPREDRTFRESIDTLQTPTVEISDGRPRDWMGNVIEVPKTEDKTSNNK